jgi:hypothetical protein
VDVGKHTRRSVAMAALTAIWNIPFHPSPTPLLW